jgi:transcriptional regulator with XRE-family HTH domain
MEFSGYLKTCRTDNEFTQEGLVHALYSFNIELFAGLDTTTLSKWERGVTQPRLNKQVSIIKYFQNLTGRPLPCFDNYEIEDVEKNICETGMHNIIIESKSKKLILDFPSSMMSIDDLSVYQLKNSNFDKIKNIADLNTYLDKNFNKDMTGLTPDEFTSWALMPGSMFWVCEFGSEIMGLLFSLKLTQSAFDDIMDGLREEKDLKEEDFASQDEKGSSYILSFFSLNKKVASMLFVRYYAYLISRQIYIVEVGAATMMEDGEKLIESIGIPFYKTNKILDFGADVGFFRASLAEFLSTPDVAKMILTKQNCEME